MGSPVTHNVESWSARYDLFHLFNAILVIDNFTLSIWSEHDHRAIAAAFVHRQNCTFRVSDFKIDIHAAARSVGERNITLDAIMLQRFTQHTLQFHTVLHFLCRNRCRIIHWTRGHNTSRVNNWSIISTSNSEKYLPLTDRIFHECPLAPHTHHRLSSTNSAIPSDTMKYCCTFERKTHKLLDQTGTLKIIILLNIADNLNSLTFYTKITQRALSIFIWRSSLLLIVVPFSWMFFLALALYPCFCPWAGCDLALSRTCLTIHECLFATGLEMDCSSCTLVLTNTGLL